MTAKTRNRLIAIFILAFPFALFSFFFFSRLAEIPPTPPVMPNPNGYDDLIKAGKMVAKDTGDYDEKNTNQVREIVSANVAVLALARAALSNQCRVPVQYTAAFNSNHMSDEAWLKYLARAFIAEGRLAEMENRPADAAKSYLDTIHLGIESPRGGPLLDGLVGLAIEDEGMSYLKNLLPRLDSQACRETAVRLETLDSQRQTWEDLIQQEYIWSHATFRGWRYDLMRWEGRKSLARVMAAVRRKFNAQEQKTHQLMIALATRAYKLDKGHSPVGVADLVPDYLKAVPQPPASGTNMVNSPR